MVSKDRRESVRVNYLCECQVESDGLRTSAINGRINDLSMDGVFIDSMLWLPTGSTLKLKLKIEGRKIEAIGEVRYFMPHVGMGVRFLDLTPEAREIIESIVAGRPLPPANAPPALSGPLSAQPAPAPVMSGDLAVVSLFDVIHIIESGSLTGLLSVRTREGQSEIQFNDGVIVGASIGSDTGISALNRILAEAGETFEFHGSRIPFGVTIRSSNNTSLILDMLTYKDEKAPAQLH